MIIFVKKCRQDHTNFFLQNDEETTHSPTHLHKSYKSVFCVTSTASYFPRQVRYAKTFHPSVPLVRVGILHSNYRVIIASSTPISFGSFQITVHLACHIRSTISLFSFGGLKLLVTRTRHFLSTSHRSQELIFDPPFNANYCVTFLVFFSQPGRYNLLAYCALQICLLIMILGNVLNVTF